MTTTFAPEISTETLLRSEIVTDLRNLAVTNLVAAASAYASGSLAERARLLQAASVISLVASVLDAQLAVINTPADVARLSAAVSGSFGQNAPDGTVQGFAQLTALLG